jgi:MarR family 2-MHQ and catechol resistance regulon transcriptional repressor
MARAQSRKREERLALDTFIRLNRAVEAVAARIVSHAPLPDSLTMPQFGVLEALLHLGPMCQAELGRKLLRTKGNVSLVVDNLASRGLVRRQRSQADKRQTEISLTAEGRRLIVEYFPRHAEGIKRAMSALTQEEQEQLGELCHRLGLGQSTPDAKEAYQ